MPQVNRLLLLACGLTLTACPESGSDAPAPQAAVTPSPAVAPPDKKTTGKKAIVQDPPPALQLPPDSGPALPPLPPLPALAEMGFRIERKALWVTSKRGNASLTERASKLDSRKLDTDSVTLKYTDDISCVLDKSKTFTERALQSRIENTRAYKLYKDDKFTEAARGFRRAAELDPENDKARTNHIAALARAGEIQAAAIAFRIALKKDPVRTYNKLLSDEDFTPLHTEFRQAKNGKLAELFTLKERGLDSFLAAYSQARKQVAVVRHEASWGSENWKAELHVFDAVSGKSVSVHALVDWQDTLEQGGLSPARRKQSEARIAAMNETLLALQFEAVPNKEQAEFKPIDPERSVSEARLPAQNASLVADKDILRLVRGDGVLATFSSTLPGADPKKAIALPAAHAIVYFGHYMVAEGCDSGPESRIELLRSSAVD